MNNLNTALAADKTFSIEAAMASPHMLGVRSLMASAQIKPTGPMELNDVDRLLSKSRLNEIQKIAVKTAMIRAQLLVD